MALTYPEYETPQPSQTRLPNLLDLWDQGVAQGKADRYEREAPQQFANATAPLSEFGLTTPPDQMRALFANPNTRPLAVQMVQEASARRAAASDPMKQLRLMKAQWDLKQSQLGSGVPAPTGNDTPPTGWQDSADVWNYLTPEERELWQS